MVPSLDYQLSATFHKVSSSSKYVPTWRVGTYLRGFDVFLKTHQDLDHKVDHNSQPFDFVFGVIAGASVEHRVQYH